MTTTHVTIRLPNDLLAVLKALQGRGQPLSFVVIEALWRGVKVGKGRKK